MIDPNQSQPMLSVRDFGARGDGQTDDTAAIQAAIDAARDAGGGGVWFPAGRYLSSTLKLHAYVGLFAAPTWSYHHHGGTQLVLADPQAKCLLDLSAAYGSRVSGLGISGEKLGQGIHGIYLDGTLHNQEDTIFIEDCRISLFTGDAIRLDSIFGFTLRDCMIIFNDGDGLSFSHYDGWVHDCIFNNNGGYGIHGRPWNGSVTVIGNRIEWNDKGGICLGHGGTFNINNNYIDRSGGPGIYLHSGEAVDRASGPASGFTIMGNVIYRSGAKTPAEAQENCHILLDFVAGVTLTGNVMKVGVNDSGEGLLSPTYGIVYGQLADSVIKDNTWYYGVTREFLVDRGGHDGEVIVKDNPGRVGDKPVY